MNLLEGLMSSFSNSYAIILSDVGLRIQTILRVTELMNTRAKGSRK